MKQGCGQVGTCHPQSDQSCFHWAQWGWAPGPCWMGAQACSTPTLGHGVLFTKITQSSSQPHAAITHVHTHMLRAPAGHNRYPAHSLVHGKHASAPPKPTPPSPPLPWAQSHPDGRWRPESEPGWGVEWWHPSPRALLSPAAVIAAVFIQTRRGWQRKTSKSNFPGILLGVIVLIINPDT